MQSNIVIPSTNCSELHPAAEATHTHDLFCYCYSDRFALMPKLTAAFVQSGGWVLERRTTSATSMDFRFELQLDSVLDLYGSLVGLGLELTRGAHTTLTDLCTCRSHGDYTANPWRILTLRLEIAFLADVTLHSMLMTGSGVA